MGNQANSTLTRQQLYDLVWSEPMTTLAKRFSISDTGLRKICKRMNIPLPNAGYWTKLRFGKNEKKTALPKKSDGKEHVTISPASEDVKEVYGRLSGQKELQKQIEKEMAEYLIVPERLNKPEKIIQHTKDFLSGVINYSDLSKLNINKLNIKVSKDTQSRALRIMDTLIKALLHRGHQLAFRNREIYVKIDSEDIKIYLREKDKRVLNEKSKYSFDKYLLQPTGILCFQIGENFKHKDIVEGKEPLELQLSKIIAALEITAEEEKQATIKRDKWHAEWERERQKELAAQQRKEKEIADFNLLLNQAERFHKACQIREYINVVERKAIDSQSLSVELVEWIKWAIQKANWLDPTVQEKDKLLDGTTYKGKKIE